MKVLLALPRPLFPADTGGKIRTLNIFTHLARRVEVHAVSLADPEHDVQAIADMRRTFHSYTPIFWREKAKYSIGFYAGLLANRFSRLPYSVAKYRLEDYRRSIEELAARERFDLVFCDFLPPAFAVLQSRLRPRILFEHNVESLMRKRYWETEQNPLRKWIFRAEWKKVEALERRLLRASDHVIAVSEDDRMILQREFGVERVSAIPTGVDIEFFRPQEAKPQPGHIVFVGSMDWYPNEDGLVWFLTEVLPRLRKHNAEVSLTIVGRNPSARLRQFAERERDVEITGRVDDVRLYLARAEVVVVPLRIGGGTRIKIPEAMAMAKPVVSTRLGAEGLPFVSGREILLEDEPEGFARAVSSLLNDSNQRAAMGIAARQKVIREHNWDIVAQKVEQILEHVIENVKHRAAEFSVLK